jgi:hypothetical protein
MWTWLQRLFGVAEHPQEPPRSEVVRRIDGGDGGHRLTIRRRDDHFTWDTDNLTEPDEAERQYFADAYWSPGLSGGLFSNADEAEADARSSLPWLKYEREDQDDG